MATSEEFNDINIEMEFKNSADYEVKLELEGEEDELGPIVDTPFRARCYTWPRQYLQQGQLFHNPSAESFLKTSKSEWLFYDDFRKISWNA